MLLAVLLGFALIGKLSSRAALRGFTDSLAALPWLPQGSHPVLAAMVLAAEGASVVLMVLPGTAAVGLVLAVELLAAFTIVPALSLRRGVVLTCRCFGLRNAKIGLSHVVSNSIALFAAVIGVAVASQDSGAAAIWRPVPVGVSVLGAMILIGWDEITYLLRPPTRAQSDSWRVRL